MDETKRRLVGTSGHGRKGTQARKCSNQISGEIPLPRPLAHYVRSLGLRRAVTTITADQNDL